MLILARTRMKRPGGGYARTFVTQMEQVMGTCLDKGIKVVTNAGGPDPDGCADAVAEVASKLGLNPKLKAFVQEIFKIVEIAFPFKRRNIADRDLFISEQAFFQNLVQPLDVTNARLVDACSLLHQLLVPRREPLGCFIDGQLAQPRRLQERILLSDYTVIVGESLNIRRKYRHNPPIEETAPRFGPWTRRAAAVSRCWAKRPARRPTWT